MREIKYRAYNVNEKIMMPVMAMEFDHEKIIKIHVWGTIWRIEECHIVQFTGVEGDILRWHQTGEVECMKWCEITRSFRLFRHLNDIQELSMPLNVGENLEIDIIKNIHENP